MFGVGAGGLDLPGLARLDLLISSGDIPGGLLLTAARRV